MEDEQNEVPQDFQDETKTETKKDIGKENLKYIKEFHKTKTIYTKTISLLLMCVAIIVSCTLCLTNKSTPNDAYEIEYSVSNGFGKLKEAMKTFGKDGTNGNGQSVKYLEKYNFSDTGYDEFNMTYTAIENEVIVSMTTILDAGGIFQTLFSLTSAQMSSITVVSVFSLDEFADGFTLGGYFNPSLFTNTSTIDVDYYLSQYILPNQAASIVNLSVHSALTNMSEIISRYKLTLSSLGFLSYIVKPTSNI